MLPVAVFAMICRFHATPPTPYAAAAILRCAGALFCHFRRCYAGFYAAVDAIAVLRRFDTVDAIAELFAAS